LANERRAGIPNDSAKEMTIERGAEKAVDRPLQSSAVDTAIGEVPVKAVA